MAEDSLDLVARSRRWTEAFADGDLQAPPRLRLAVVTCMDARVVPEALLDLRPGDAQVLRNAGGRVTADALRSLALATRLLGVRRVAVIHHTDCGNAGSDAEIARRLEEAGVADPPLPLHANRGVREALAEDLAALRTSPLLPDGIVAGGWLYEVTSGRLREVIAPS